MGFHKTLLGQSSHALLPELATALWALLELLVRFNFIMTCMAYLLALNTDMIPVAELVPQKELQPTAFSVMPLVWSIGSIFGPILGGALASPAKRYPTLFGENVILNRFPFALPNMVAAVLFCIGVTTGILFLKVSRSSEIV